MYTKQFKAFSEKETKFAGGKGGFLAKMTRAGLPVPPGFIILTGAFEQFLKPAGLEKLIKTSLYKIAIKNQLSIEKASKNIRKAISRVAVPQNIAVEILYEFKKLKSPLVAVRSSATSEDGNATSWAGELETYLNVEKSSLIPLVKKCWSSLFTPRAIVYRLQAGLIEENISVAVVVQKMVQSEVSGVCFTANPVSKDKKQMVIEAGFGLGEAVVAGMITPDNYLVEKGSGKILQTNIHNQTMTIMRSGNKNIQKKLSFSEGSKQKLSNKQIALLARLCKKVERYFKSSQDIEWAFEKNKFYITQSRPITTL